MHAVAQLDALGLTNARQQAYLYDQLQLMQVVIARKQGPTGEKLSKNATHRPGCHSTAILGMSC